MRFSKKIHKVGSYFAITITRNEAEELGINDSDRIVNVALISDSILIWAGKKRLYKFFDRFVIPLPKVKFLVPIWAALYNQDKDIIIIVSKDDDEFTKEISEYIVKTYEYGKQVEREVEELRQVWF